MSSLLSAVDAAASTNASLLAWLGQAGLLLRTASGRTLLLDPYLSDECEAVFGLQRQVPAPFRADEVAADIVLITHWHEDHLDAPIIRELARDGTVFIGPPSCQARIVGRGVPERQTRGLTRGQTLTHEDITVTATFARHEVPGFLTEDAIGFLLEFDGLRLLNIGDTEYDRRAVLPGPFDLCVLPINGTGGNMDAYEAALLASKLDAAAFLPLHFGMWKPERYGEAPTLDPALFVETYRRLGGAASVIVPQLGEVIPLQRPTGASAELVVGGARAR